MSVTILEGLMNAEYNLKNNALGRIQVDLALEQLHNAVTLLEKGYSLSDKVEPLLEAHGTVENVPDKA
jgi:hypothetical protein